MFEPSRRARAIFFLASYIGINRYNKLAMANDHGLCLSSQMVNDVHNIAEPSKYAALALFDNAPYLRRYRVNGRLFVTSFVILDIDFVLSYQPPQRVQLPEPPNMLLKNTVLRDFVVDTMVLTGNTVVWLPIDGRQAPFDITGHYPILAGYEESHKPLYVAAVKIDHDYYFTVVEDGASTVRYTDEVDGRRETHEFLVLGLRYDPSDLTPPYPHASAGAMDATGPLRWLKFWPEKDAAYYAASDSAKEDDSNLESFLNSLDVSKAEVDNDVWWWG